MIEGQKDHRTQEVIVTSDYLSKHEVFELQGQVSQIIEEVSEQEDEVKAELSAPTGNYIWGKWVDVTITANRKKGTKYVTAAVGLGLGLIGIGSGVVIAKIVNCIFDFKMDAGYFKKRVILRRDTNPDYVWQKETVKTYRDRFRTNLLRISYTDLKKVRVY